jgi:hypothetical protein
MLLWYKVVISPVLYLCTISLLLSILWLSENCRELGIYGGRGKQAIAIQVQEDALEQMLEVENTVATPLEDLDLVVEAFDKATILALDKIVGNFLPPRIE